MTAPNLTDLSPLADAKELMAVTLPPNAKNFEFLRSFPKLERISFQETEREPPRQDRRGVLEGIRHRLG